MSPDLFGRILSNSFLSNLLEHQIDDEAFSLLCDAIVELAGEWKTKENVNKRIVLELYTITCVMLNEIPFLSEQGHQKEADELEAKFIELHRLVSEECLY